MVNGNDILEYEEAYEEYLTTKFIEENRSAWDVFVLDEYNNKGDCYVNRPSGRKIYR